MLDFQCKQTYQQLINANEFSQEGQDTLLHNTYWALLFVGGGFIGQEKDYAQYYLKNFKYGTFF